MKLVILVLACIAGALAQNKYTLAPVEPCTSNSFVCFFKDLGNKFTSTMKNIGDAMKDLGNNLVKHVANKATDVVSSTAKVAGAVINKHIGKFGEMLGGAIAGKRSVSSVTASMVDFIRQSLGKLEEGFKNTVDKLTQLGTKLGSFDLKETDFHKEIKDAVSRFETLGKSVLSSVEKRSIATDITDELHSWKGSLSDFLKPCVETLTQSVHNLGTTLLNHADNLMGMLKDSVSRLSDHLMKNHFKH